jgi:hypothetical protein
VEVTILSSIAADLTCDSVDDVETQGCVLSWTLTIVNSWLFVIFSYISYVWGKVYIFYTCMCLNSDHYNVYGTFLAS